MKKLFKYLVIICVLFTAAIITAGGVSAQVLKPQRNELSLYAGGGLSTLQYKLQTGRQQNGIGMQVGGGYTFFFTRGVGLGTGLELDLYQASARLSGFSDSYDVIGATVEGNYTYTYKFAKYTETQRALIVNIPLMLHFEKGRQYKYFLRLGGKAGFPVKATGVSKKNEIATEGYFPHEGRTYDDLPQYGCGKYEYLKRKTSLDKLNLNYMASVETGVKWKAGTNNDLYAGVYADYGLGNLLATNDKTFVKGTLTADKPTISSIVESQYAGKPFTEEITPLAVGVKVRFTFMR